MMTRFEAILIARNAVRRQGYAVAVHGTQVRDLDLVAIPWQETAIDADTCAQLVARALGAEVVGAGEAKPYGRIAHHISPVVDGHPHSFGLGFDSWYVDLSVMPRSGACCACSHEPESTT